MNDYRQMIHAAVQRHNGSPQMEAYLTSIMRVESAGRANAANPNSSARGLFQFINSTWDAYGNGRDIWDPQAQCDAVVRLAQDNARALRGALGREPTAGEYYLAHFAGAGGAKGVLNADDDTPISGILGGAAMRANADIRHGGKRFGEFTARDLRGWAESKMGADIGGAEEYNYRRRHGGTSAEQDAAESERRIRQLVNFGYDEKQARALASDEILGAIFIAILENIFDAASTVPNNRGIDQNRAAVPAASVTDPVAAAIANARPTTPVTMSDALPTGSAPLTPPVAAGIAAQRA